jgi:hypothetical protein
MAPEVKFPREIHQGVSGKDVIAHKRAISRARPDLYKWSEFTPIAGDYFMDAVVSWKVSRGLGRSRVLGGRAHEVLERTHRKGSKTEWAFDARAVLLAKQYYDAVTKSPEERIIEGILSAANFWYDKRLRIPYEQQRPFPCIKPPTVPRALDCLEFVTICYFAGGAKDPNGRGYDGQGYTGTMSGRGTQIGSINQARPGDLLFYGRAYAHPGFNAGDPTHVGLYAGKVGNTHMSFQMGSYPMKYIAYNYRHDLHHIERYSLT